METMQQRLREILAEELEVAIEDLDDSQSLADLGVDSLTFVQLFTEFQDEFDVDISIHDLNHYTQQHNVETIGDFMKMVNHHLDEK